MKRFKVKDERLKIFSSVINLSQRRKATQRNNEKISAILCASAREKLQIKKRRFIMCLYLGNNETSLLGVSLSCSLGDFQKTTKDNFSIPLFIYFCIMSNSHVCYEHREVSNCSRLTAHSKKSFQCCKNENVFLTLQKINGKLCQIQLQRRTLFIFLLNFLPLFVIYK
jgi:hypothetical protein